MAKVNGFSQLNLCRHTFTILTSMLTLCGSLNVNTEQDNRLLGYVDNDEKGGKKMKTMESQTTVQSLTICKIKTHSMLLIQV